MTYKQLLDQYSNRPPLRVVTPEQIHKLAHQNDGVTYITDAYLPFVWDKLAKEEPAIAQWISDNQVGWLKIYGVLVMYFILRQYIHPSEHDIDLATNTNLMPTLALINEENPELFTVIQAMADRPTKSSWDFVDCCLIIYELMRGE